MGLLLAVISGFAGGVFFRSLFVFGWEPVVFVLLIAAMFAGARFLTSRIAYTTGAVFCIFVALGMVRTMVADTLLPNAFARDIRHRVSYEGVVVSDPDVRDANQRVEIRVLSREDPTPVL